MNGIDPYTLAYIGIFIGALLAFEGVRQGMSRGREDTVKSRRMRMIAAGATPGEVLQLLKPQERTGIFSQVPFVSDLPQRMRKAGVSMRPRVFLLLCLAAAIVLYLVGQRLAGPAVGIAAAALGGLLIPFAVLDAAAKKRTAKLIAQLPDALDLMSRGLKVGHPLNATMASVANEMADPIGTEFGIVVDQISYGDDLVDAFKEMADRLGEEDLQYLAVSIAIQHGTGGNLSRLLGVLAKVIRDRATMRRKIKAITSEARGSMWVLSSLPLIIYGAVNVLTPDFYGEVKEDPLFMPIMILTVILVLLNFLVLRKLVNFRF